MYQPAESSRRTTRATRRWTTLALGVPWLLAVGALALAGRAQSDGWLIKGMLSAWTERPTVADKHDRHALHVAHARLLAGTRAPELAAVGVAVEPADVPIPGAELEQLFAEGEAVAEWAARFEERAERLVYSGEALGERLAELAERIESADLDPATREAAIANLHEQQALACAADSRRTLAASLRRQAEDKALLKGSIKWQPRPGEVLYAPHALELSVGVGLEDEESFRTTWSFEGPGRTR